jgi:CP family cyanate transporter-like MFS transporter
MSPRPPTSIVLGVFLLALNLRPAAASIGPVLPGIHHGIPMSATATAVLTALPLLAFALFSATGPAAARLFGIHRATVLSLLAIAIGLISRSLAEDQRVFLVLSLLGLAGAAMATVLLPQLVMLHVPDRARTLAAPYSRMLALGFALTAALTAPISHSDGGWRTALAFWGVFALLSSLPWLRLMRHDLVVAPEPRVIRLVEMIRTPTCWAMAGFFGLQALQMFVLMAWFPTLWHDNGYTSSQAGLLVALAAAVAIPLTLTMSAVGSSVARPRLLVLAVLAAYPLADVALLISPHHLAVLAAVLMGVGGLSFPLAITLVGRHARTIDGALALSGVSQMIGYLIAMVGPFVVGMLYGHSGTWDGPLTFLLLANLPLLALVPVVLNRAKVEDELPAVLKRATPTDA